MDDSYKCEKLKTAILMLRQAMNKRAKRSCVLFVYIKTN